MNRDMIFKKLTRVREQLAELQVREKTLAEELDMADRAARRELAENSRLTPAELRMRMSITEHEIAAILAQREKGETDAQEEAAYETYEKNETETEENSSEM